MISTTRLAALERVAKAAQDYQQAFRAWVDTWPHDEAETRDKARDTADIKHMVLFIALDELEKLGKAEEKAEYVTGPDPRD